MLHLWYSTIYTEGLSPEARFPRDRYRLVREGLEDYGKNGHVFFHEPTCIDAAMFELAHCPLYTKRFLKGQLDEQEIRRIGLKPWTEWMVERTRMLTNGTVEATRHVLNKRGYHCAGNIGGGTHHAYYDFGSGYCIFNDLAIAARMAQQEFDVQSVLILDLDVHQGDGTAAIFADDPSVRTVSLHCQENFPFRKMTSDLDMALPKGVEDQAYLAQLQTVLAREPAHFIPELILYQAGVDPLATDRLGHLNLTPDGISKRNQMVFNFAQELQVPLVITMGGGYGEPIQTSSEAHIELFKMAAKTNL